MNQKDRSAIFRKIRMAWRVSMVIVDLCLAIFCSVVFFTHVRSATSILWLAAFIVFINEFRSDSEKVFDGR